MMRLHLLCAGMLFVAVTLAAGPATAQEPRLAGRLSPGARATVDAVLDSARRDGLPLEPLVDRALEGATKGAGDDRIVAAVRRLAADLTAARDAFGPGVADAEIAAGASALRAGARGEDLTRLRTLRPGQSVTVAAAVLTDLVALGVPPDTATAAVLSLAELADDATYLAFRRNVERDVALGATPVAALTYRLFTEGRALQSSDETATPGAGPNRPRKP
jgi:hypothetical protein